MIVEKKLTDSFFEAIKQEMGTFRTSLLLKKKVADEGDQLRTEKDALIVLESLKSMIMALDALFTDWAYGLELFEKDFGSFKDFTNRDNLIETSLLEDFLFPENSLFPIVIENQFNEEITKNYVLTLNDWIKEKKELHEKAQLRLKESVFHLESKNLDCSCQKCIADFRGRFRDDLFQECIKMINGLEDKLKIGVEDKNSDALSSIFYETQNSIQKLIYNNRKNIKRSSLNKIENSIQSILKGRFGANSEIGKKYCEKLVPMLRDFLVDEGISQELVDENNLEKFFRQMSSNIWRGKKFLQREFSKFITSVLKLKRKDISSAILQEYLGQFWLHSEARRKNRKIIYHMGPTNSGKTFHAVDALCSVKKGCYLAPLRLLAGELYDTMNAKGVKTNLLTGEEVIEVEGATHYSSTVEMARLKEEFDCAVIDEIQMMSDPQRGWAWTRALIGINSDVIHICGDDTVQDLVQEIVKLTGDTLEFKTYERLTKLEVLNEAISVGELKKGDALIVFSRRNALKYKSDLEKLDFKVSIVYGMLGPEVRREQARKFDAGETDIIVSTDAIAMGMNLPIKRIVFTTLSKFIDNEEYHLTASEIKQIAGRAGRYLRFPVGYITCLKRAEDGIGQIRQAMVTDLKQKKFAMVGPDLDIFAQVNLALRKSNLTELSLTEFLRLFNTMDFVRPFFCVELDEMIELAEIVEEANNHLKTLTDADIFGFSCAPVHLGLSDHLQYYIHILNNFIRGQDIGFEEINSDVDNIDYLETSIKCIELYQWLARHFDNRYFKYNIHDLHSNKSKAITKLNLLLSEKLVMNCSSCGGKLPYDSKFTICESCFHKRRDWAIGRRAKKSSTSTTDSGKKNSQNRSFGTQKKRRKNGPRQG